ncbi:uncharacterized protein C8Q71DRAFT_849391 [Rhodofomes roseus]|uniref:Uncharacterized protein n=1 Tax=Rhodofomes roseus TaxID=34475 RepID=A0ABQ8KC91_9APHY|nr:uncharacterized protein C8Q71DRAFT_849391 [Rhodofomes roseus]KAH9834596.1 hypothetical protein C8Q71DRAFT_849391 [Rhodofomes roseus]
MSTVAVSAFSSVRLGSTPHTPASYYPAQFALGTDRTSVLSVRRSRRNAEIAGNRLWSFALYLRSVDSKCAAETGARPPRYPRGIENTLQAEGLKLVSVAQDVRERARLGGEEAEEVEVASETYQYQWSRRIPIRHESPITTYQYVVDFMSHTGPGSSGSSRATQIAPLKHSLLLTADIGGRGTPHAAHEHEHDLDTERRDSVLSYGHRFWLNVLRPEAAHRWSCTYLAGRTMLIMTGGRLSVLRNLCDDIKSSQQGEQDGNIVCSHPELFICDICPRSE